MDDLASSWNAAVSDESKELSDATQSASKGIHRVLASTIDPEPAVRRAALEAIGEITWLVARIYDVLGASLSSREEDEVSLSLSGLLEMRGLAPAALRQLAALAEGADADFGLTASLLLLRHGAPEPRCWDRLTEVLMGGEERPTLHLLRALAVHPFPIPAQFSEALRAASGSAQPSIAPSLALARFAAGHPASSLTDLLLIPLASEEEDILMDCFFVMQRIFESEAFDLRITGAVDRIARRTTGLTARYAQSFLERGGPRRGPGK